ncbi:MAG: hypothetical protein AAF567_18970 [Actinomycetota bacterium]
MTESRQPATTDTRRLPAEASELATASPSATDAPNWAKELPAREAELLETARRSMKELGATQSLQVGFAGQVPGPWCYGWLGETGTAVLAINSSLPVDEAVNALIEGIGRHHDVTKAHFDAFVAANNREATPAGGHLQAQLQSIPDLVWTRTPGR